jgi:hypothetical protein
MPWQTMQFSVFEILCTSLRRACYAFLVALIRLREFDDGWWEIDCKDEVEKSKVSSKSRFDLRFLPLLRILEILAAFGIHTVGCVLEVP